MANVSPHEHEKCHAQSAKDPAVSMVQDQFGVSWQVVPMILPELLAGPAEKSQRAMKALLQMKKLDIAALKRAYEG